jgi:hypothetical protein
MVARARGTHRLAVRAYSTNLTFVIALVPYDTPAAPAERRAYVCKWCGGEPHSGRARCHAQRAIERERSHGRKR